MKLGALWHRVVQDAMHSIKRPNASQRLSKDGEETQKAELLVYGKVTGVQAGPPFSRMLELDVMRCLHGAIFSGRV